MWGFATLKRVFEILDVMQGKWREKFVGLFPNNYTSTKKIFHPPLHFDHPPHFIRMIRQSIYVVNFLFSPPTSLDYSLRRRLSATPGPRGGAARVLMQSVTTHKVMCRAERKSRVRPYLSFCSADSKANKDQKSAVDFLTALVMWKENTQLLIGITYHYCRLSSWRILL